MSAVATSDTDLVLRCLAEGAEAFSEIVTRYQSLVCAVTYNATGSLSRSEDLAQEVFLTAWKELRQLREPAKLRSWLCGIARRLTANTLRREGREPACAAEELVDEHHAPASGPAEQAISREEEAILWRSLEQIPENYREPLILFYREGQSVEHVATALELTEDATKQRLSRGRKMLQEQVALFVEGALRQSTPGRAFTLAVMLSLPAVSKSAAATAGATTAAKGAAAVKGLTLLALLGLLFGPVLGAVTAWIGIRAGLENAQSDRERQFLRKMTPIGIGFILLLFAGMFQLESQTRSHWDTHPALSMFLNVSSSIFFVVGILALARWSEHRLRQIRAEENPDLDPAQTMRRNLASWNYEYKSPWTLLGLPLLHVRSGHNVGEKRRPAVGWIAVGDIAVGVLFSFGGFAFGGISLGVFAFGLVPLGILSAGVLAFGALISFGLWGAMGATAVGYLAQGGHALAWHAAVGARAVAHDFALGLHAVAPHANDPAAHAAIASEGFFQLSDTLARHSGWVPFIWLPCLLIIWQIKRLRRGLKVKIG